jgi:hypothetical protein
VLAAVVSIATGSAAAANYAQESLDRYIRIEYQVEPSAARPVVSGYVYNMHPGLPADRMQLAIEAAFSGLRLGGDVVAMPVLACIRVRWGEPFNRQRGESNGESVDRNRRGGRGGRVVPAGGPGDRVGNVGLHAVLPGGWYR